MDYTKTSFKFKIQKILRYTRLYGPQRTLVKIDAQRHLTKQIEFSGTRWISTETAKQGQIAIIGCGNFAYSVIAYYLHKHQQNIIKYAYDIKKQRSFSLAKKYKVYCATSRVEDIFEDENIKLIYIASNHASHSEYAIKAIEHGKSVHIEKPHSVSMDQLNRLIIAAKNHPEAKVFVGFNRPKSSLFQDLKINLSKQAGPIMMNWFIAGHQIDDEHWYFSKEEGGRILGNLCHWSDLCLHLVGYENAFPCTIHPAHHLNLKSDFAVSITFADHSMAVLTFSAKGHTFEGVREYLNVHKGDLLGTLHDFHHLNIDCINHKYKRKLRYRDHGHQKNILNSYTQTFGDGKGDQLLYIYQTGLFILKIKEAIETGQSVVCDLNEFMNLK